VLGAAVLNVRPPTRLAKEFLNIEALSWKEMSWFRWSRLKEENCC
jgi:hypothetical protein